jgi:hypothetical protein
MLVCGDESTSFEVASGGKALPLTYDDGEVSSLWKGFFLTFGGMMLLLLLLWLLMVVLHAEIR